MYILYTIVLDIYIVDTLSLEQYGATFFTENIPPVTVRGGIDLQTLLIDYMYKSKALINNQSNVSKSLNKSQ